MICCLCPACAEQLQETLDETAVLCLHRFAHGAEHPLGNMLGGDLQPPAHVMPRQLLDIDAAAGAQRQVETNAAADEDMLHSRERAHRTQQLAHRGMIGVQLRADVGV